MLKISEKHDTLFHYTNGAGLKGILETQCLHATHYKFSNDDSEMAAIKSRLTVLTTAAFEGLISARDLKDELPPKHKAEVLVSKIFAVTFGNAQNRHKFFEPYIVSFCGHIEHYERQNGLLSMWRGYGRDQGYAIAFDTPMLEQLIKIECELHQYDHSVLGNIIYSNDEAGFKEQFPDLDKKITELAAAVNSKNPDQIGSFYSTFTTCAALYKHEGFKEEQEVRLCLSPRDPIMTTRLKAINPNYVDPFLDRTPKEILFKESLSPYISLFHGVTDRRLPIRSIIVGPHADKERRRQRLMKYLELKGLEIEVRCSETPFV